MGPRTRAVLARLALAAPRPVGVDRLIEDVWGDATPQHPTRAVQIAVSRLRSALDAPQRVTWDGHGYRLHVERDEVDVLVFDQHVARARQLRDEGHHASALHDLDAALELWRGRALTGIGDAPFARDQGSLLDTRRLDAVAGRLDLVLALRGPGEALDELRQCVVDHPLHERLRGLLMLALYRHGEQALAVEVFQQGRDALAERLGTEPGAELQRLHVAILRHDPTLRSSTVPRPPAAARPPGTIPQVAADLTSLVGRQAEMDDLDRMLTAHRLVTVTGTGGSGKSRLTRELARRRAPVHPDGVWFVDLAPVLDGRHVATAVARALGLSDDGHEPAIVEQLARAVGQRRVLVALDNCEHVLEAAGRIACRLLARCPRLHVVATSREPLGVPGEHRWSLRGLPLPPRGGAAATALAEAPSVRLFLDRANQADPDFTPDDTDLRAIAEVCRQVAGLPLAVELAAAWVRVLSCRAIADQLDPSSAVLAAATTTPDQRQSSLRRTLDWSHDRLDADARTLLSSLSVFRGPITLTAVEQVLEQADRDIAHLLTGIRRLVDTSLVEARPRGPDGPVFRLLEPVRQYAATHLHATGHERTLRHAHARWCRAVWQQAARALRRHRDPTDACPLLAHWYDDLRAALDWCVDDGQHDLAAELLAAGCIPWWTHGMLTEGVDWARRVLPSCGAAAAPARAAALAGTAFLELHLADDVEDPLVGEAEGHARLALALLDSTDTRDRQDVRVLAQLALAHAHVEDDRDLDRAGQLVAAARNAADATAAVWAANYARVVAAGIARQRGDLVTATALLEELLSVSEASKSSVGIIAAHYNLGRLALREGAPHRARHHLEMVKTLKDASDINPFARHRDQREELTLLARADHQLSHQ